MDREIHPFEFEQAMQKLAEAKAREAKLKEEFESHISAARTESMNLQDALKELAKPFVAEAKPYIVQLAREELNRPKAGIYVHLVGISEEGISLFIVIRALLTMDECKSVAKSLAEQFSKDSLEATSLDPHYFYFHVEPTRIRQQ